MKKLRTICPYGLNDRYGDEYKIENTHINVAIFSPFFPPRKHNRINCRNLWKSWKPWYFINLDYLFL